MVAVRTKFRPRKARKAKAVRNRSARRVFSVAVLTRRPSPRATTSKAVLNPNSSQSTAKKLSKYTCRNLLTLAFWLAILFLKSSRPFREGIGNVVQLNTKPNLTEPNLSQPNLN